MRATAISVAFYSGGLDVSYRLAGFCVKAIMASKVDCIVGHIAQTYCEASGVSENPALLVWMIRPLRPILGDQLAHSRDWRCVNIGSAKGSCPCGEMRRLH